MTHLSPLHPVVQTLKLPQVLEEVEERGVGVGAVVGVVGALVMDEGVGRDVLVDDESRDTHTQASVVVGDIVRIGETGEGDAVLWGWNVDWWRDVVCKATVLIEVDDLQNRRSADADFEQN